MFRARSRRICQQGGPHLRESLILFQGGTFQKGQKRSQSYRGRLEASILKYRFRSLEQPDRAVGPPESQPVRQRLTDLIAGWPKQPLEQWSHSFGGGPEALPCQFVG